MMSTTGPADGSLGEHPALGQAPIDRWQAADAADHDELDLLVYRSNRLGRDPVLVNWGGGNTSCKWLETDFRGRASHVLRVKASGFDLATMGRDGFVGVRLDDVLPLQQRRTMSDDEMVGYLAHAVTDPAAPHPSVETLLHAFIRHPHIDHTHPDAGLAFCTAAKGEELARRVFGTGMAWVPYQRPGFALARRTAELVNGDDHLQVVFLASHGVVTWGETARSCYQRTIEVIGRCAEAIRDAAKGRRVFGPTTRPPLPPARRREVAVGIAPVLRGVVGSQQRALVHFDDSPEVLHFLAGSDARALAGQGTACPDHLIRTKATAQWVDWDAGDADTDDISVLKTAVGNGAEAYAERYRTYLHTHRAASGPGSTEEDPYPRIVLIPGIGLFATGRDKRAAQISAATYRQAIAVMGGATALDRFAPLSERHTYDMEYWPLERRKLSLAPPEAELSRHVAVVTGAASGIGQATAWRLARAGAHVVLADINAVDAAAAAASIEDEYGDGRALAIATDVTEEASVRAVFQETVLAYGGVDIMVNNAGFARMGPFSETTQAEWRQLHVVLAEGYFLVAREAFRLWQEQALGGSLVFVASKNALAAGRDIAAYSAAKAASLHLARCLAEEGGPHGIRVNSVCPDAVIAGSGIWSDERRQERARTYGIQPDQLQDYYRRRTALNVTITPDDVAEAVLFFASSRSAKTTGAVLTVDGGVPTAYVR